MDDAALAAERDRLLAACARLEGELAGTPRGWAPDGAPEGMGLGEAITTALGARYPSLAAVMAVTFRRGRTATLRRDWGTPAPTALVDRLADRASAAMEGCGLAF